MPAATNSPGVLIYLSFAEENTANKRYSLGQAPFVILENTDNTTFQGIFTPLMLDETTDPMRVYIEGIEIYDGFDKYFTSMLKHPLY